MQRTIRILLSSLLLLLFSCKNDMQQVKRITARGNIPDAEVKRTEILYTDSGILRMRTLASKLKMYSTQQEEPYTEFPEGIKTYFYDSKGKINASLSANYAKYFPNKKLWDARYEVELINVGGDILSTEQIFFDEEKEQLYSSKYVHILLKGGGEVEAYKNFRSNMDFTWYKIDQMEADLN